MCNSSELYHLTIEYSRLLRATKMASKIILLFATVTVACAGYIAAPQHYDGLNEHYQIAASPSPLLPKTASYAPSALAYNQGYDSIYSHPEGHHHQSSGEVQYAPAIKTVQYSAPIAKSIRYSAPVSVEKTVHYTQEPVQQYYQHQDGSQAVHHAAPDYAEYFEKSNAPSGDHSNHYNSYSNDGSKQLFTGSPSTASYAPAKTFIHSAPIKSLSYAVPTKTLAFAAPAKTVAYGPSSAHQDSANVHAQPSYSREGTFDYSNVHKQPHAQEYITSHYTNEAPHNNAGYHVTAPPTVQYATAAPAVHYATAAPAVHYATAAPAVHYVTAAPAVHYTSAAPVVHYDHAAQAQHAQNSYSSPVTKTISYSPASAVSHTQFESHDTKYSW